MLGYVKICKPQLRVCEYDTYKAVYCTLCKYMGKRYGHLLRMTLSYDFAFLTLLALSMQENACTFEQKHCVYRPWKKCHFCCGETEAFEFSAAVSVMMTYYSLIDKINDEHGVKRLLAKVLRRLIHKKFMKATIKYPEIYDSIATYSKEQFSVEKSPCDMDAAAEPTAKVLGKIFQSLSQDQQQQRVLNRMGYCTGKWIYMTDALDDLSDDVKYNRFNPLKQRELSDAVGTLNVCSTDAGLSFELLNAKRYDTIIKNIYYLGMPDVVKSIVSRREKTS